MTKDSITPLHSKGEPEMYKICLWNEEKKRKRGVKWNGVISASEKA